MIRNTKSTLIEATLLLAAVAATATYLWRHYARSGEPEPAAWTTVEQRAPANPFAPASVMAHSSASQQATDISLADLNAQIAALAAQLDSLKRQAYGETTSQELAPAALTLEEQQQRGDAQADAQEKLCGASDPQRTA